MIVTIGDVTGDANPVLASIIAPSTTTLESNGALAILIKFNSLVGTSTVVEVGSRYAEVISPSLTTWKNYIGLAVGLGLATPNAAGAAYVAGTGSISADLDYDKTGAGAAGKYAAGWSSGTIDTPLEVASIDINQ